LWCRADLDALAPIAGDRLQSIIVPKVEEAEDLKVVESLLGRHAERIDLQAQIETPKGVVNIREIARASDRLVTLIFGPGDYAAALGVPQQDIGMVDERYPGHQWHWVMSEIAAHAHASGLQAIDGPYVDFGDEAGYRESALRARLLGFDGKWCIHPNQVSWANESFSPDADELARAKEILDAYDEGLRAGRGAISVGGKLVDEASRKLAEATLARAADQGYL
jgi:citrate lyase beta subunit